MASPPDSLSQHDIDLIVEKGGVHRVFTTPASVQKRVVTLQQCVHKNSALRAMYQDEPYRFVDSELELDDALSCFGELSAKPELIPTLLENDGIENIVSLLAHPNPDIAQTVITVLTEILDSEVLSKYRKELTSIVDHILNNFDFVSLLAEHISNINEGASEEDFECVTGCLQLLSNLLESAPLLCLHHLMLDDKKIIKWLLNRLSIVHEVVDTNTLYIADLIADMVLYLDDDIDKYKKFMGANDDVAGLEHLLTTLSHYRKLKTFPSVESRELVKTVTDTLVNCLLIDQEIFTQCQGVDLIMRFFNSSTELITVAECILPIALRSHGRNCNTFVKRGGLAHLFPMLMGKSRKYKPGSARRLKEIENMLTLLSSIVFECTGDCLTRVIAKFTENGLEKLKFLFALMEYFRERLSKLDEELRKELNLDRILDFYSTKSNPPLKDLNDDASAIELQLHNDKCEDGFVSLLSICRIILKLPQLGDRRLQVAIHHIVDREPLILNVISASVMENAYFTGAEQELSLLHDFENGHDSITAMAKSLIYKIKLEQETVTGAVNQEERERLERERTERNRDRRQRHKIRRMDAEFARQQRLEEARWEHKKGNG